MHKIICTILDVKSGVYSNPFYSANVQTALRDFCTAFNDPSSMIAKYPADYQLIELGTFDDVKCEIKVIMPQVNHGSAIQFIASESFTVSPECPL